MDKHFLEFWGNFLLNAARGKKQLEEMAEWIHQGPSGLEDLNAMFKKYYGLNDESPDYLKAWRKAEGQFQKSLKDYLSLLGVVPKQEYLELVKKYEELKETVAAQEESVRHLRMLLEEKGLDAGEVISGFEKLMAEQGEQFRELMKSFSEFYRTDKNES